MKSLKAILTGAALSAALVGATILPGAVAQAEQNKSYHIRICDQELHARGHKLNAWSPRNLSDRYEHGNAYITSWSGHHLFTFRQGSQVRVVDRNQWSVRPWTGSHNWEIHYYCR